MAKIIISIILFFFMFACGKKGDIPVSKTDDKNQPARIENERIYKF